MEDIIDIIVTETTNTIEITAQPNDEIIDVNIIDNREDIVLNVTPTVVEININSLTSNFGVAWGDITGTLADQTDLNTVLTAKANLVDGKVPSSELPSYVDDVVEVATFSALPATGEIGKIYVILDTNKIYRWSGSTYIEIADSTAVWGAITGTLSNQTDLQTALDAKQNQLNGTGFVKISGTTISYDNSTYALDADVVKLAGAQTITGLKTFSGGLIANVSTGGAQGFASTNTSSSATSVFVQNNSTGIGILANNALGGDAILIGNDTSGRGIYITNATISGGGKGISIDNYNSGIGIEVGSDSSADAIKVLHLAGRAFNIQSSGGGYGVIINNTTASTSAPFTIQKQGASVITFTDAGAGTFNSSLTASSFVKTSGTSSQFLKADGSVDSSTYALDSAVVKLTGNQTVAGIKTMSNIFKLDDTLQIKNIAQLSNNTGYTGVWAETAAIGFYTGANAIRLLYAGNYNYTMPSADGTLALTSQLSAYLPLAGGTLTGALSGTSATFSSNVIATSGFEIPNGQFYRARRTSSNLLTDMIGIPSGTNDVRILTTGAFNVVSGSLTTFLGITDTGAATFSSSVAAASLALNGATLTKPLSVFASDSTGNIRLTRAGTSEYMNISTFGLTVVGNDLQLQSGTSNTLQLNPSGGNVGIGNTSPNRKFLVQEAGTTTSGNVIGVRNDNATSGAYINFIAGGGNAPSIGAKGNDITFTADGYGGTELLRITSSGNVGIGTTAPTSKLHIEGTGTGAWLTINRTDSGTNLIDYTQSGTRLGYIGYIGSELWINNATASDISIRTSGTERMRITSGGDLCVGKTSSNWTVNGLQTEIDGKTLGVTNASLGDNNLFLRKNNTSGTVASFYYNDTQVGYIAITSSSTSYNTASDYRLKEDLKPINGLEIVNKIKVYDYKWKAEDSRMDGVLAHELAEVLPYAVTGEKDGERMQGVDYSKIVPVMVQAIKELKAELDTLKNK